MMPPVLSHPTPDDRPTDVNAGGVFAFGVALALALVIALVMLSQMFAVLRIREIREGRTLQNPTANDLELPPTEPHLQVNPREALRELRAREDSLLNSYGWIDQPAGIVHVPIEEAMKRIAQQGLPARPAGAAAGGARR